MEVRPFWLLAKTAASFLLASNTEDPLSDFFGLPDKIVDDGVSVSTGSLGGVIERADETGREAKAAMEHSSTNRASKVSESSRVAASMISMLV